MLELLIDPAEKTSVRSLYDDRLSILPDRFPAGDVLDLSAAVVDRIRFPFSSRLFAPQSLTDTVFNVAIGGGFDLPVAGSFTLTFTASDLTTQTTDDIPFDATAQDIEAALNALSLVTAAGGLSVSGNAGFFVVTFNDNGARYLLSADPADLVPISIVAVNSAILGDDTTREVQTLRLLQNAGALDTLSVAGDDADATIDVINAGGSGVNAQFRVTLTGELYSGSWTFSLTGPEAETSQAIPFDDSSAQIQQKLEDMANVGAGNVNVVQEDEFTFLIEFIGDLADTTITAEVDGTNLLAIPTLTGSLDMRTPGINILLNGDSEKVVTLEVEQIVGVNPPRKILQRDVVLVRPVIEPDMNAPQPADQIIGSNDDLTVNDDTGSPLVLSGGRNFAQWFQLVNAEAGDDAYTYKFALNRIGPRKGAFFRIEIDLEQSANPTIEFYDSVASGTPLQTVSGDSSNATYFIFEARFDGSVWKKSDGRYIT